MSRNPSPYILKYGKSSTISSTLSGHCEMQSPGIKAQLSEALIHRLKIHSDSSNTPFVDR